MDYALIFLIIWRLLSVWIVQTSHVPDEYWQSLEVAHKLTFGYGYLTWEWNHKIRSYIYPFIISILYKILDLLKLDNVELLIYLPRIIQGILSGYGDYRFYIWTKRNNASLFLLTINWYWYYCASRTIVNTLETSFTMIALSIFPWKKNYKNTNYIWIVGFICAIRPTMAIIWTPLCFYHLLINKKCLLKRFFFIGICTMIYSIGIDSFCYGEIVLTSWNFFKTNFINSIGDHYGKENLLWYLTSGLPVLLGLPVIYLPFSIVNIIKYCKFKSEEFICLFTIVWTVFIFSMINHKEFRFLLPVLPLFIFILTSKTTFGKLELTGNLKKIITIFLTISNLLPGLYFSIIHQRGPLDLLKFLQHQIPNNNVDVLFLMPCHSTPFYSHLHQNITMKFITCEPNFHYQKDYLDESDKFFQNPSLWINQNYNNYTNNLPHFIVTFDSISTKIQLFLKQYNLTKKIFHAHFSQPNSGQYIFLYRLEDVKKFYSSPQN